MSSNSFIRFWVHHFFKPQNQSFSFSLPIFLLQFQFFIFRWSESKLTADPRDSEPSHSLRRHCLRIFSNIFHLKFWSKLSPFYPSDRQSSNAFSHRTFGVPPISVADSCSEEFSRSDGAESPSLNWWITCLRLTGVSTLMLFKSTLTLLGLKTSSRSGSRFAVRREFRNWSCFLWTPGSLSPQIFSTSSLD